MRSPMLGVSGGGTCGTDVETGQVSSLKPNDTWVPFLCEVALLAWQAVFNGQ